MPASERGARLSGDDLHEVIRKIIPDALEIRDQHLIEGRHIVEYLEGYRITSQLTLDDTQDVTEYQWVPFPLHWSILKTILPSLYINAPRFMLRPSAEQHASSAQQREAYYNWCLREQNWDSECYYGIWNALVTGWGIWQIGWGHPWGDWPADQHLTSGAPLAAMMDMLVDSQNPAMNGGGESQAPEPPPIGTKKEPLLWPEQNIREGRAWIKSILPEDFAYDPEGQNLNSARYAIITHYMPRKRLERLARKGYVNKGVDIDEIKSYEWYPNLSEGKEPRDKMRGVHYLERFRQRRQKVDQVRLFSYWNKENGQYHLLADEYDQGSLVDKAWPAPAEDFPMVMFGFNERQGRLYPQPELALVEPLAQQMNVMNSLATEVSRKAKTIVAVRKGMLQDEEIEAIRSAEPLTIIQVSEDIKDSIQVLHLTEVAKRDWLLEIDRLWAQARNVAGVPEQELGNSASGEEKATKSAIMDKHSKLKQGLRKQVLRSALERVGRKYDKTWRSAWAMGIDTPEQELRVLLSPSEILKGKQGIGRDGEMISLGGMSVADAEAEMDVYIEAVSMTPMDRETLAAEIFEDINIGTPLGAIDPFTGFEEMYRLRNVRVPGLLRERPQLLDPLEEAILMLQGIPANIQPGENVPKHSERHNTLVQKVNIALSQGNLESGDPVVDAFVVDASQGGQAFELLKSHAQQTEGMLPSRGTSSNNSAVAPGRANESASTSEGKVQRAAGVPDGSINTSQGQAMGGQ